MKRATAGMLAGALLMMAGSSQAASTSGGIILKEAVGARAQGMGEMFVGVADDATALYWNPGGLSDAKGIQGSATYVAGLAETAYQQVMFSYALEKMGTIGLGVNMLQGGKVELEAAGGGYEEVESQSDLVVNAGYGMKLNESLGLGIGVKVLNSTLVEEYTAMAVGVDIGGKVAVNPNLSVGVALQNVGTEITYDEEGDPLPLTVRVGGAYGVEVAAKHAVTLGADVVKANDADAAVHVGGEYWYDGMLAVRVGYKAGYELESLTAGIGVRYDKLQLDYAFGLVQELNSTHKVTLSFKL